MLLLSWLGDISILIMKKCHLVEPYVGFRCLKYHKTLTLSQQMISFVVSSVIILIP